MKKLMFLSFLSCVVLISCEKQSSDSSNDKVDNLFKHWDKPGSPGAAVAVVKDGEIVFSKGYGSANLEYDIPITPSSIFHIASESKQFTAFCLVLLQQEGKLNLEDDIRKYLPYVPDFGKTITIRHLIYHTSGLRDQWQLLAIGGESIDDVIRQEHVTKLVENQKELNFEPGSRHLYCNTGYTLMAEIVKKASGKSMREYADEKIFKPLGMDDTHFHDDNTEVVKGRTYSYDKVDGKFVHSPLNYATIGATSLFTTVEDEAKWLTNYESGKVGGKDAIEQMYEQGMLNNGTKLKYAFGLVIDSVNGYKRIGHGGADAGYRSYAVRFPEVNLGVVVFGNLSEFNPQELAMKVAELYLPKRAETSPKNESVKIDNTAFKFYEGFFSSPESQPVQIVDSSSLYIKFDGRAFLLTPLTDTTFDLFNGYATVIFPAGTSKSVSGFTFKTSDHATLFTRVEKASEKDIDHSKYVGVYESDELETQYHIVRESGKLILRHRKYPDVVLVPVTDNQFSTAHWWMDNLLFNRDAAGNIVGFEVNAGRVLHLKFQKQ